MFAECTNFIAVLDAASQTTREGKHPVVCTADDARDRCCCIDITAGANGRLHGYQLVSR